MGHHWSIYKGGNKFSLYDQIDFIGKNVEKNKEYAANARYQFLFTQATFTRIQMIKEFGLSAL